MPSIDQWRATFEHSLEQIERYRNSDNEDMRLIANWLMDTEANPYSILQPGYVRALDTAEGFAGLLQIIHHALVDDGEITFVAVNGRPMIAFAAPDELHLVNLVSDVERMLEKRLGKETNYEIIGGVTEFIARQKSYDTGVAARAELIKQMRNQRRDGPVATP